MGFVGWDGEKNGGMAVEYELYIDVLFLTEFLMDLLALYLTAALLRRKLPFLRATAAAVLGSLWTCVLLLFRIETRIPFWSALSFFVENHPPWFQAFSLFGTIFGAGSAMAVLAFGYRGWRRILGADLVLLLASALCGGIFSFLRETFFLGELEAMICMTALCGAARAFFKAFGRAGEKGRLRYPVTLYYRGKSREFMALSDSGNRLTEPVSGKPVSVISREDCAGFCDQVDGLLMIPYRAVGTEAGFLPALLFEKMVIHTGDGDLEIKKPVVAVARERLSGEGSFSMLLSETLLFEERQ